LYDCPSKIKENNKKETLKRIHNTNEDFKMVDFNVFFESYQPPDERDATLSNLVNRCPKCGGDMAVFGDGHLPGCPQSIFPSSPTSISVQHAETLRILGELDLLLGTGCNAALPDAVRALQSKVAELEKTREEALDGAKPIAWAVFYPAGYESDYSVFADELSAQDEIDLIPELEDEPAPVPLYADVVVNALSARIAELELAMKQAIDTLRSKLE
jgi:hypothetical protein